MAHFRFRCLLWAATMAVSIQGCGTPSAAPEKRIIRLTAGMPGGGVFGFAEGLAAAYRTALPHLSVEPQPSSGAVANVDALERGEADVGFTFANLAYASATRRDADARQQLRAIAVLQVSPAYLVVRPGSGIEGVGDLRGRRVATGAEGSGGAVAFELILGAYGLRSSDLHISSFRTNDAAARLLEGRIDALFVMGGFTTQTVSAAMEAGAEIRPLRGPAIEELRRSYSFLRPAVIPPNAYGGVSSTVRTIGMDTLYVCRSDLDEQVVYELTKAFFDALPSLARSQEILRFSDLDQAPAAPIPLHPGAARYYRERQLIQ